MSKFQVGDRVELVEDYHNQLKGTQGTVSFIGYEEDSPGYRLVNIRADGYGDLGIYDKRLKLVAKEAPVAVKDFRYFLRATEDLSIASFPTFEAALAGWKETDAHDGAETEIIEIISHGTYKATLKVEAV